jgi:diguanylate cyclase (GGDEF)-like protein
MDEKIPPPSEPQQQAGSADEQLNKNIMDRVMSFLAQQNVDIAQAAVANEDKLQAQLKETQTNAELDDKTGLFKPTVFESKVRELTKLTRREGDSGRKHALILADFDKFHEINELLGYQAADSEVLIPTALKIKKDLRQGAIAGRFGGEEFVVFIPDVDLVTALAIGVRIQNDANQIKLPRPIAERDYVGLSMAIVEFKQGEDYVEKFNEANALVDQAKKAGRNQIMVDQERLRQIPLQV